MSQKMAGSGSFRLLHTMIRVLDLEKSIDFYCRKLGMDLLRKTDYPDGKFTLAFVGYGCENSHSVIELTHNWDKDKPYDLGDSWGHVAIGVKDIYGLCSRLEKQGVPIPRQPGPMKHGATVLAFIDDPDGHKIELIQI
jgi:lactoylglutathione lyase